MRRQRVFIALVLALGAGGQYSAGDGIAAAVGKVQADIEAAVSELNALRESHAEAAAPLESRLDALGGEVRGLDGELTRLRGEAQRGAEDVRRLEREVSALEETRRFSLALLEEYRRSVGTRVSTAEMGYLADRLGAVDAVFDAETAGGTNVARAAALLLELSETWSRDKLGGMTFGGRAIDEAGFEHEGEFAVFGPVGYFAARDGGVGGVTVPNLGSLTPSIRAVGSDAGLLSASVATVLSGREAVLPVDVTGGDALKIAEARAPWYRQLRKGGVVMIPLLAIGVIAALLALLKSVELAGVRFRGRAEVASVIGALRAGDADAARRTARGVRNPLGALLLTGIEHASAPREHLEEILYEHILARVPALERHLGTLAVFGGVAPLLGLLGTVTGMIHTFQLVTIFGTGEARLLSGGISEALITTECGLAIAIPVLIVHAFLARRVRTVVAGLEAAAAAFVIERFRADGAVPAAEGTVDP